MPKETMQEGISRSVTAVASFVTSMFSSVLSSLETYTVGRSREYFNDRSSFNRMLLVQARKDDHGVAVASLGFLGNVAAVVPASQENLATILDQLDTEPKGRQTHASFQFFSSSQSFILSETGSQGVLHRKQISGFLVPPRFVQPLLSTLDKELADQTEIKLRESVCHVVRAVISKVILGIDSLPEDTYRVMKDFRADTKEWGAFQLPGLLGYIPGLSTKKTQYTQFAQGILDEHFSTVKDDLKHYTQQQKRTLFLSTMIHLIKQDNPDLDDDAFQNLLDTMSEETIRQYFEHDSVQVIPFILKAADNLADAITLCLSELPKNQQAIEKMRDEIIAEGIFADGTLDFSKLMNNLPFLDAWYKECLRFDSPLGVPRYTETGIHTDSIDIPAHTTVLFDLAAVNKGKKYWQQPELFMPERFMPESEESSDKQDKSTPKLNQFPFMPFSAGTRMCPAFKVTECMFKTYIAYMVTHFDLHSFTQEKDDGLLAVTPVVYDNDSNILHLK